MIPVSVIPGSQPNFLNIINPGTIVLLPLRENVVNFENREKIYQILMTQSVECNYKAEHKGLWVWV